MSVSTVTTFATSIPPTLELLQATFSRHFIYYLNQLEKVPGGLILLRYVKSSYRNDPLRSLFEFALFVFAVLYYLSSKKKENKAEIVKFSKREMDDLIDEWEPAPLVQEVSELERWRLQEKHVQGQNSAHVQLVGRPDLGVVTNLSSNDFLNLNASDRIKAAAKHHIRTAGVGACGPPNFYGTQDVHVRLEEDLARFLGTEQAILYGQDFVTAGSVIPAFLKRGDLAVVDAGVSVAIQKALIVSRCDIEWFDHNDVEHLEQILTELQPMLAKQKPLRRRFIVTEGLFAYSGDLVKLPEIVALKNKFKYRLFLDESLSVGTVGASGRGVTEHYGISRDEIAITMGSLATSFVSSGGFCAGVRPMVHHQRISSYAYVFSASLPPYSAKVASEAISIISERTDADGASVVMKAFHKKVHHTYDAVKKALKNSRFMQIVSHRDSPILHLAFTDSYRERLDLPLLYGNSSLLTTGRPNRKLNPFSESYNIECYILQQMIDSLLEQSHTLVNRTRIVYEQENLPIHAPRLLIHVTDGASLEELDAAISALPEVVNGICSKFKVPADLISLEETLLG